MDKQYDIDPEMKKLFEIKSKQRAEAKEYFQRLLYNPYRPLGDGIPFDPSLMRFNALNSYRAKLYEPTPKFYFKAALTVLPVFFIFEALKYIKNSREEWLRSGLVKYEDRYNKFWM